jgi:Zn-dependent protease
MEVKSGDRPGNLRTIPLGHVLGIPIGVHYSWFTILVLLTWALAVSYYPAHVQGWPTIATWLAAAVTAMLVFVGVLLHELAHALVALHFQSPVRNITLFIFGGVAQIDGEAPGAVAEFWIAVAGPVVSLFLAAAFGLLQAASTGAGFLPALAKYLAYVNGTLALFNLLPGFPLDGGRVLRAIVWAATRDLRRATLIATNLGRGVSFLLVLFGVWQIVVGNFCTGLWSAFIGWFLETAGRAEVRRLEARGLLARPSVWQAMGSDRAAISDSPWSDSGRA